MQMGAIVSMPSPEIVPEAAVAVSIQGVSRHFDDVVALKSVTLDIRKGEFFSLLGPSGCGKTTLLRIIGGFEQPSQGNLLIGGLNVAGQPPYARRSNMVFQHGALFPHLNVAENIAFGLEMQRVPAAQIAQRVGVALEMVRLVGYGARRVDQLSGGQRQRVALARALVNEPEVLLLDEPLSALDLQLRLQLQNELRRLQRDTGGTFIFVTHDQGEAMSMSDRIAVMQGGEVLQVGTPRSIYEHPRKRFVAEFMGHSNILTGTIASIASDRTGVVNCLGVRLHAKIPEDCALGADVVIAIRYERVELTPCGDDGDGLTGVISESTFSGSTIRYQVLLSNGVAIFSEAFNTGRQTGGRIGSRVRVEWSGEAASVLSA
jgi:spermidine/putrescine transport system ATP-binding protein